MPKAMLIGERLRSLREERQLSQGDIEKRTGLFRCYISRVENGHTVPSLPTLERIAAALGLPLYRLFYVGEELPEPPEQKAGRAVSPEGAILLNQLRGLVGRIDKADRRLLLSLAQKLAKDSSQPGKHSLRSALSLPPDVFRALPKKTAPRHPSRTH